VRIRLSGPAYAATQLQHQRLHKRHPILEGLVDGYRRHRIHPLEHFASVVDPNQGPVKVLISLYALPSAHNGTSEGALSLTEAFLRLKPAEWEVSIVVNPQADTYHYVSERFPNVHHPDTLQGLFHVAFVPSQIFHPEHLLLLTRHALRVGFQMLDIISLRCPQLLTANPDYHHVFGLSLMLLDGIGYNSDYTRRDVEAYFTESAFQPRTTSRVIHQAVSPMTSGDPEARLPFDDYLLVLGNVYAHKSLDECLAVARQVPERNFIILGIEVDGEPNVHGYASGHLADEFVAELYKRCTALLFPSQYEGFGLPLLQAVANGKPCILLNNEQNRELADTCLRDFRSMLTFFDSFAELPALLRAYEPPPAVNGRLRTWDDVARETMALVEDILAEPVDARRLERRWKLQGALDVLNARGGGSLYGMGTRQIAKLLLRRVFDRWPLAYRAANVLRGRSPSGGVHAQTEEIVLHHGRLVVGGWAFIPARRIASARLLLDGQAAGEEYTVVYGLERPDVGQAHGFRRAQRSGFRIEGPAPEKVREMRLELLSPRGRTVGSLRIAPAHERRGASLQ
jgi:glycosyltransferase involved in cell wall biosynthesis